MGVWGQSPQRDPGQRPWSGSQGRNPPVAEALLVLGRSLEAANLPVFLKFGNTISHRFVLSLQKIMGGHKTGAGAKLGGLYTM